MARNPSPSRLAYELRQRKRQRAATVRALRARAREHGTDMRDDGAAANLRDSLRANLRGLDPLTNHETGAILRAARKG